MEVNLRGMCLSLLLGSPSSSLMSFLTIYFCLIRDGTIICWTSLSLQICLTTECVTILLFAYGLCRKVSVDSLDSAGMVAYWLLITEVSMESGKAISAAALCCWLSRKCFRVRRC